MTVPTLRRLGFCLLGLSSGLLAPVPTWGAAAFPQGDWLTEDKDAAVSIGDCGGQLCGRIVWLETDTDRRGAILVDDKNPDPAMQTRRICGLVVITDLKASDPESWDGRVYNPQDGRTYHAKIAVLSRQALRIRAYIGLPMFGRSQTWTRLNGPTAIRDDGRCSTRNPDGEPVRPGGDRRRAESEPQ